MLCALHTHEYSAGGWRRSFIAHYLCQSVSMHYNNDDYVAQSALTVRLKKQQQYQQQNR